MPTLPRPLKITLAVLAALLVLLAGAVAVLLARFDSQATKALLVEQAQQRWQRTLAIPGDIEIGLVPRLGLKLGALSLSEPRSSEVFASWRSAQVSLALWPLLWQRQLVVDRVTLDGLQLTLRRDAQGRLNIADLLGPPATRAGSAPAPASAASATLPIAGFAVAGIAVEDASITVDDKHAGRRLQLSRASLRSGSIAPGQPFDASLQAQLQADHPLLDATLALQGRISLDPAAGRQQVQDLRLDLAARRLATLTDLKAGLRLARADLNGQTLVLQQPALTLQLTAGATALQARLDGAQLDGDLAQQRFALPALKLAVDATLPPGAPQRTLALQAGGRLALDLGRGTLDSALDGQVDQSRFKLRLGMPSLAPASFRVDAELDSLNLDRYRSAAAAPAAAPAASAPPAPLDLSALQGLRASGRLQIGTLQVAQLKLQRLRTDLQLGNGQLQLDPLALDLYQGSTSGSLQVVAAAVPRLALQQTLRNVAVGPLLQDLLGKAPLEGRGDVTLDLRTQGTTVAALPKALAGSARAELRDGMVKGFNIAQTLRNAKARLGGGSHAGTASAAESTDFSALSASLRIAGGVAHNDDLQLVSPLLRVGGSGDIDIGNSSLDYLVKATIVPTLQGQGGPELQALRGQTVPVRLHGPFNAIGYSVDLAAMAKDLARDKLDDKAKDAAAQAKQRLGDKLKGLLKK